MLVARPYGEALLELCRLARTEVVLIAPFVKEHVMSRVLSAISPSVRVRCATRWRPDEIVAGVSDLGVWNQIKARTQAELILRADLHAKYYRFDDVCVVGSANLTQMGLGWARTSNAELLVRIDGDARPELVQFESEILNGGTAVDQSMYELFVALTAGMPAFGAVSPELDVPAVEPDQPGVPMWRPSLRAPSDLYRVYRGDFDILTTGGEVSAREDLRYLDIPPGLTEPVFDSFVGAMLLQIPLIGSIDRFLAKPRRFGEMTTFLKRNLNTDMEKDRFDAEWQKLIRWLLHFLPHRYFLVQPSHTEVFGRRS